VLALARDLVARSGCGFLMVTHSARLAATLDRQVNLHAGVIAMKRALWTLAVSAQPLAAASDAACDPADRADFGDRLVERRAGAEPAGAHSYDRAAAPFGGARTAMLVGRDRPTFPQKLVRRPAPRRLAGIAGVEGRDQIGGRSFRLLGIEPVTCRAKSAARRRSDARTCNPS
jgi:hypothetical protein